MFLSDALGAAAHEDELQYACGASLLL